MALLYDQDTELKAIRTIVDGDIPMKMRMSLLGRLNKEHFYNPPTLAAFNRISTIAKKRYEILSRDELVADPVIDEDLRDVLKASLKKVKPNKKRSENKSTQSILERYRKIRALYAMAASTLDELEKPEIDLDVLMNQVSEAVSKTNSGVSDDQFFLNFGTNDTSKDIVDRLCTNEQSVRLGTGYAAYDKRNGGLPDKGVFIISATTSGGKSTVAMNLGVHLYLHENRSICRISLEMDDMQETRRLASHLTQIPFNKFKSGKLSITDKQLLKRRMKEFTDHGQKHGITHTTISPDKGVSIDEAFAMVSPFGYKIIMIDYIGLLTGMDAQSQWFQLNEVAAQAKRFSNANNCLVIILAQLDDTTDKLRYAKGIKEHADTMWQWNYTKPEQRELRILPVRCEKDRDGEVFNFELAEAYDVMTARNMPDEASSNYDTDTDDDEEPPKKKKKDVESKGKSKKAKFDDAPVGKKKDKDGKKAKKAKSKTRGRDEEDQAPETYALT